MVVKIGELARRSDVNVQTVRYYERRGLLPDPREGVGGYREYGDADVDRLRFVKEAQSLGFTLEEIEELVSLRSRGTAREVRERAREKLDGIREKIAALRALERNLVRLIAGCSGSGSSSTWSIMNRLESSDERASESPPARRQRRRKT